MRFLPLLLLPALAGCMPSASVEPRALTAEFRTNPQGLPTPLPRLAFKVGQTDPAERGVALSAYRLIAAESPDDLAAEKNLLWDTGTVTGDNLPTSLAYAGQPLASRSTVWWKVRLTDKLGRDSGWSTPASFSVGLLTQDDWDAAQWIGLDAKPEAPLTAEIRDQLRKLPFIRQPGDPARTGRVAVFTTHFDLKPGAIREAWFAGCPDQFGTLMVNGTTVAKLARWDLAKAYDAKAALRPGDNTLWLSVSNEDGFNPAASGMLVIRFADNSEQRIVLDKSWKYTDDQGKKPFDELKPVEEARGQPWGGNRNTEHFMPPAPYLRTTFTPDPAKTIAHATLYATALGVYEPHLNGRRIANDELTPGWTEFSKRVYHQTYDVTPMITRGPNSLGAVLGDGWYAGLMGYTGQRRFYGGPARFKARLEIAYTDGSRDLVATGPDWLASFGPILHTDNYMGSEYDARREIPGWDTPGYDTSAWRPVESGLARGKPVRELDVTDKVQALLSSPHSLKVGPDTLGEPCFGVVKTLRIEMTASTGAHTLVFKEGETVNLPRPGELNTTITKATFGEVPPPPPAPFVIEPQPGEPVRRFEELPARSVNEVRPGRFVFDLGQNMVGWTRLKVHGKAGQRLTVRHAEMLNPDGTPYTSNLRGATATDFYTLKDGWQTLEPPFTFHGFQFVEISGLTEKPDPSMVTGIVTHTDMAPAGTFSCSSDLVNKLVHNIVWGQKGNYLEVPTDCPQRDERLGWTGDAQFFVTAATYNFDIAAFMSRWLKTLNQDAQFEDGTFAHVAPKVNERGGSTAWGDAAIMCTRAIYWTYGDTRVIADNYDAMARYTHWLDGKTKDGIAKVGGFGDWLNLGDPTSPDLIDTAQRIQLLGFMAEMARVIGKPADADRFDASRKQSIDAFRHRFLAPDASLKESGQTGYAMAFTIDGLLPDETRTITAEHFAAALGKKNNHLATGFIGTPRLLPALYNARHARLAETLLLNEDYPSWLYQVKLGATTMWERWDGWTPDRGFQDVGMNSFNHYAFGAVGDALYSRIAGISALEPAYRKILLAPNASADLSHAQASYDSASGTIRSAWRRLEGSGAVAYDFTIPPNTSAEIHLHVPFGAAVTESGTQYDRVHGVVVLPNLVPASPQSGGLLRLEAPAGTYHFLVTPQPPAPSPTPTPAPTPVTGAP